LSDLQQCLVDFRVEFRDNLPFGDLGPSSTSIDLMIPVSGVATWIIRNGSLNPSMTSEVSALADCAKQERAMTVAWVSRRRKDRADKESILMVFSDGKYVVF